MDTYQNANDLPDEWDGLCGDNYALRKDFLSFMERVNPCGQKYYVFRNKAGKIDTILMTFFKRKHNLAMFSPVNWYVDVTFIYVPLSIARPGLVCGSESKDQVEQLITSIRGVKVVLNITEELSFPGFTKGYTCFNIMLDIRWKTFEGYMQSLRSNYRYRYNKALKKAKDLAFYELENNRCFSTDMYNLYEQVYNHSHFKVEKLSIEFFKEDISKIIVCAKDEKPVGFVQLIENDEELVFAFVGFDHEYNNEYDIYMNLLLKIVEYGIAKGFKIVDLGQTADEAKLKLGGRYIPLYALVHHSNPVMNRLIKTTTKYIQFKPLQENFHVFKDLS